VDALSKPKSATEAISTIIRAMVVVCDDHENQMILGIPDIVPPWERETYFIGVQAGMILINELITAMGDQASYSLEDMDRIITKLVKESDDHAG